MDIARFDDYELADALWTSISLEKEVARTDHRDLLNDVRENLIHAAHDIDETVARPLPSAPELTGVEQRQSARAALSASVITAALNIGVVQQQFGAMAAAARGLLQKVLQWFLNHLFKVLNTVAAHLKLDSWSVEVSGGFPWGVNVAITLTFS